MPKFLEFLYKILKYFIKENLKLTMDKRLPVKKPYTHAFKEMF